MLKAIMHFFLQMKKGLTSQCHHRNRCRTIRRIKTFIRTNTGSSR